jgi:type IX secretion system PorP/SprF family membrane protein
MTKIMGRVVYLLIALCWLAVEHTVRGQNDPLLSQYYFNPLFYNPAAAGSEGVSRFQLMHRTQYAGYQPSVLDDGGGPSTQLFSYTMPLDKIKSGVGVFAMNDRLGPAINQALQISYAYRLALKDGSLAIGVQGGLYNRGFDFGQFRPNEPDPLLQGTGRITQARPDIGVGVYYNTIDYWIGVSAQHLTNPAFRLGGSQFVVPQTRTMYLTAGYRLGVGYDIDVQPSILVSNFVGNRVAVAANITATYMGRFWLGGGYQLQNAWTLNAGASFLNNNALRFGYAFDMSTASRAVTSLTSHEIMLSYALPTIDTRKKPIVRTPRFRY